MAGPSSRGASPSWPVRTEPLKSSTRATGGGPRRPSSGTVAALVCLGDDFEDEYPGASALATGCYANLLRAADLLMELHNRQTFDQYQLSASARQILAVIEGAGQPLEPSVIAERLLVTTGSMTSLLDNLERRGLIVRRPHPEDRRKLLIDITPAAQAIVDALLPSLHARERDVMAAALSPSEQRSLLRSLAKLQRAALEARSAPAPSGAIRRRPNRAPTGPSTTKGGRP
jgi:DNA-binding MarR family transcriptional regulator